MQINTKNYRKLKLDAKVIKLAQISYEFTARLI